MFHHEVERVLERLEEQFERELREYEANFRRKYKRRHGKSKEGSLFTFEFSNNKFSSMSNATLKVPSGTKVTGFNTALLKGVAQPDAAYKSGSCKYGVIPGPSGNPPGFSVAPGAREQAFIVTENTPGAASDGIITFDALDANGDVVPQSQGTLIFTAAAGTGVVADESQFNFDQTGA